MTTPEQLEIALRDFIYQCGKRYENELGCDDCIYWNFVPDSILRIVIVLMNGRFMTK